MKSKQLLTTVRATLHENNTWVEALILRRYENGRPTSFRIDDSTAELLDLPVGYTHVLVVIETPLNNLIARATPKRLSSTEEPNKL